ncbi:hypothetical protein KBY30_10155 [Ruegeria pomeroyi]|nr:hypothetical protein [Ruegeria pomeroyi]
MQRPRKVAGTKCDLMIKTHGQTTTSSAIRLAKRLEKFDPLWFEEPVPPGNSKEMARVSKQRPFPDFHHRPRRRDAALAFRPFVHLAAFFRRQ